MKVFNVFIVLKCLLVFLLIYLPRAFGTNTTHYTSQTKVEDVFNSEVCFLSRRCTRTDQKNENLSK